jgi:hypothetical protein
MITTHLTYTRGGTLTQAFVWRNPDRTPIDLTGATASMTVWRGSNEADVLATLSTETGGITLGGTAGTVSVSVPATTTVRWSGTVYYRIMIMRAGGNTEPFAQGRINQNTIQ